MEKYSVIEDLTFTSNTNGNHYIVSDILGVYLKVSSEILEISEKITKFIKSENLNGEVDVKKIFKGNSYEKTIDFLKKYSLVYEKGNTPVRKSTLETELIGHKVKEIQFEKYNRSKILVALLLVMLLANIPIFLKNAESMIYSNIIKDFMGEYSKFNMLNPISIASIIIVMLLSILIHESAHILFANLFGVLVRSVSLYLLLGFQPVVFVKYKNIIALEKQKKILIYLGGFIANLMMINVSFALVSIYKHWIFGVFIIVNLFMITDNLSIINNTDFYYVLTEISNTTTFKVKILRKLGALFNRQISLRDFLFNKENLLGNLYLLVGTFFRISSIYLFVWFIISSLISMKIALIIAGIVVITYMGISMKKFRNNIKMAAI
ncbi:hypothetical protein JHL18_15365 [Clostridium sp. YIM B02505]|uniref:Peptidase M50 n=1 Tax=Clostridium yunnanense TaxID=2800325 RepID=A0ABS1ERP8_9CLOT|nr:hypothetical protein [Clostridium yunnanense]MBK1812000.1 hypothetical protein [Clostridium yunnanense]